MRLFFLIEGGTLFMLKLGNIYIDFFGLGIENKLRLRNWKALASLKFGKVRS